MSIAAEKTAAAPPLASAESALAELARRTAMLDAVGYAATRIIGGTDWQGGVQELLNRLGEATGVSRVSLFETHRDAAGNLVQSCRYDWGEPGLSPISTDPRYQNMSLADEADGSQLDEWLRRRQRGEVVQATLGETTGYTRQVFEEHGTLSFASVPIMVEGAWWGFLGFDDNKIERVWTPLEIDVLKTAAALIAGAIARDRAERRLRLSEERYALAARGANDGLWDWDIEEDRAYFSPRLYEILGLRDEELGASMEALFERLTPLEGPSLRRHLEGRFARRRRKFELELKLARPDGRPRWLVSRGLIVYGRTRPRRVVGSLRDITDRKRAETSLRESEARVRAILETALDAIVAMDEAGRIVDFNPAAERMFGHGRAAAVGRLMGDVIVPPEYRAAHAAGLKRYLETGERRVIGRLLALEAVRADGSRVPIELSVTEVSLAEQRLFTAFIRDITERRRFEAELKEAENRRANLARYFSPNMVDELMQSGRPVGLVRTQEVTVLFADMIGFSAISAVTPGPEVIALLREFHALIEHAVFAHGGTLDKYLGDGLMATFGTPRPGPQDASNAVACAREMARSVVAWSRRRQAAGLAAIQIGIGLHYGEVTLGDIGNERLEFTAVGDTVNIASRIEDMTRPLATAILASQAVIDAVRREGGEAELADFRDLGEHALRGHGARIRLWGRTAEAEAADAAG